MCELCQKYGKSGLTETQQALALRHIGEEMKKPLGVKEKMHLMGLIDQVLGVSTIEPQDFMDDGAVPAESEDGPSEDE